MKSFFENALFGGGPWTRPVLASRRPVLGLTFEDIVGEVIEEAPGAYRAYTEAERAEEVRKAAQAQAAAAQAQAQAAQATAAAAQATAGSGKILGIPTPYLVVGGLGLAAIGVILAASR